MRLRIAVSLPFYEPWDEIAAVLKEEKEDLGPPS
jgi:hypothetical protein